jgi:hypothetical protein
MFYPLTIYKQLIILHYNIGFVKSEDINKHDFFSKIIIKIFTNLCKVMVLFYFMAHLIM